MKTKKCFKLVVATFMVVISFSPYALSSQPQGNVESVTIDQENATLILNGPSMQLTVTVLPENATNKEIIWSTSDSQVVAVDPSTGRIFPTANVGTAIITATSEGNSEISDQIEVTVLSDIVEVQSVAIDQENVTLILNDINSTIQ